MSSLAITTEGAFISASVCAAIRHPLMRDLAEARRNHVAIALEIAAAVELIDNVGAWWDNKRVADVAPDVARRDGRRCEAVEWTSMSVSEASTELKITESAVKGLLKRETLHGLRGPRVWLVCVESVTARKEGERCQH
jgi:hypothetical protein